MLNIGVIGASYCSKEIEDLAEEVGREIARRGFILLCGGLGGVMEAAARGAKKEGGITVGILPGPVPKEANRFIDVKIATNMGHARNIIIVQSSHALIAIGGEYGTLSEIAIALKLGKPLVGLNSWNIEGIIQSGNAKEAVEKICSLFPK